MTNLEWKDIPTAKSSSKNSAPASASSALWMATTFLLVGVIAGFLIGRIIY